MKKQRAFAVEQHLSVAKVFVAVRRAFKTEFKLKRHENSPDHKTILAWVKEFPRDFIIAKAITERNHGHRRSSRSLSQNETLRRCAYSADTKSAPICSPPLCHFKNSPHVFNKNHQRRFKYAFVQAANDPRIVTS